MGWDVVERVSGRGSKVIWMNVSRYTREDKYGEGSRQNIQERYEENTGENRNGHSGGSRHRGI